MLIPCSVFSTEVSPTLRCFFTLSKEDVLNAIDNHFRELTCDGGTESSRKLIIVTAPAVDDLDRAQLVDRIGSASVASVQILSAKPTEVSSILQCLLV